MVLYAYSSKQMILCSTTGISEAGEPVSLPFDVANEELGAIALAKLLETDLNPAPLYSEHGLAHWRAYSVSGAKTGRSFEESSVYVSIQTVNTALRVEAGPRKSVSGLYVGRTHSLTVDPEELGASIRSLLSAIELLGRHDAL